MKPSLAHPRLLGMRQAFTRAELHASRYAEGQVQAVHQHAQDHLSLVLAGHVSEEARGERRVGGALTTIYKSAGLPHANVFGPLGAMLLQVRMRGGSINGLLDPARRMDGWRWEVSVEAANAFLALSECLGTATSVSLECDPPELLDLLAILTAKPVCSGTKVPPVWLARVVERIREGWVPGLTARTLADECGVHPVYLARCVRRWYGRRLGDELRSARLASAATAVALSRRRISAIAHEHGYSDHAHMARDLRARTGMTPRRYRRLVGHLATLPACESREAMSCA